MKLSFVIPAFNEEKNISQCLESIIKEIASLSLQNECEIIVVDNNSTDSTAIVAKKFVGVKVLIELKKGPNFARALGLSEATGDLVAHIDADNSLSDGWLKKVLNEFEKDKNLVCLSGPFLMREFSDLQNFLVKIFYYIWYTFSLLNNLLKTGSMVQGGNYIVRREVFEKAGGHNTKINFYGDDSDISRRIVKFGKVKFSFDLSVYSSGRRLLAEGIFLMGLKYGVNYIWIVCFKRPFSKEYQDHR